MEEDSGLDWERERLWGAGVVGILEEPLEGLLIHCP